MYWCLITRSGHMLNRFDGLILSNGLLPSESVRISEDFHFNVVNVGLDLIGDVPTIVVHNSISVKLKIFLLTLIMSFPTSSGGRVLRVLSGVSLNHIYNELLFYYNFFFNPLLSRNFIVVNFLKVPRLQHPDSIPR